MDLFPPDRFPNDPTPATSFSPPHPPSMPPPHSSFRSSDAPDPFKISFLKGPKRKRLAKVCCADLLHRHCVYTSNRPAMLATRASGDAMAPVSLRPSHGLALRAPVLIIHLAPCSNWYVLRPKPSFPIWASALFLTIRYVRQLFCRQRMHLYRLFWPACSRTPNRAESVPTAPSKGFLLGVTSFCLCK
jgi:hypothetical protein